MSDLHEIYAIAYGRHDRPAAMNFIDGDPHDNSPGALNYFVWAIVGEHGNFVVDTGFDQAMGKRRQRTVTKPIAEGLKAIAINPDTIENVIVLTAPGESTVASFTFGNAVPCFVLSTNTSTCVTKLQSSLSPAG